jgi:co-chaperonin GroES (HSP10)
MTDNYVYDVPLKEGDVVIFNHIVCQKENKFSDTLFFCDYFNIYAKVEEGKIIPLEDVFFSEPIIDKGKTIGCFNVPDKVSDKKALVYEVSNMVKAVGVKKGDIVFFTKNADYPMEVGGKELYKMHLRNVIGIERDGELIPYSKKLLIKNTTKLGMVGGLERIYASNTLQEGKVLHSGATDIPKGTIVTYFNGMSSAITWKDEDYSFVEEKNLKYSWNS